LLNLLVNLVDRVRGACTGPKAHHVAFVVLQRIDLIAQAAI